MESQIHQAEHVKRSHQRRRVADIPKETVGTTLARPCLPENCVLREKSGERKNSGNRQRGDEHGAMGDGNAMAQVAHVAHVLLAAHGVDHRTCAQKEQRFEKRMREDVEDAGGECSHAEREKHVAELRDGRVRQHALDVVLHQADRRGENCGQSADDRNRLHRSRREYKQRIRARDHVDASRDHGRGMDERGNRRGAFHGIGQPDVERKLRGLAAGSDEEQQGGGRDDGIADGEVATTSQRRSRR